MKFHFQQALRAIILLSFSGLIFKLHHTGEITKLINPKYVGLSQLASILFLLLFLIQLTRIWTIKKEHHHCHHEDHSCQHDHGNSSSIFKKLVSYLIIVFPIVTGLLLPAKVLDASIADKKGGMAVITNQKQKKSENTSQQLEKDDTNLNSAKDSTVLPNQKELTKEEYNTLIQKLEQSSIIKMDDFVYASYYEEISKDLHKYKGREIELTGFVYKEEGFNQNQLVISRFLITHCVADASIIGFLSEFTEASTLKKDTWIKAIGHIEVTIYNGMELPLLKITKWEKIIEPKDPYLYPISIRIL